jgi:hypothetical protein
MLFMLFSKIIECINPLSGTNSLFINFHDLDATNNLYQISTKSGPKN